MIYHRRWAPLVQDDETLRLQLQNGEIWGRPRKNVFSNDDPLVKAFLGPLPENAVGGIEFETDIPPRLGCVPELPLWEYRPPEVNNCQGQSDCVCIKVKITKYRFKNQETVIL